MKSSLFNLPLYLILTLIFQSCASSLKEQKPLPVTTIPETSNKEEMEEIKETPSHANKLQTIHFNFNSSNLTDISKEILKENALYLESHPLVNIQIEGHCDERGGRQYNLALGEQRSRSTKNYLINLGISSERITIFSFGKDQPLAFEHNEEAWAKNRRGNFIITTK